MAIAESGFRFPTIQDRVSVIGSTGEGKTQFSVWLLLHSYFNQIPYIIWDYKRDPLIAQLDAKEITFKELPKHSGLYVLRPDPMQDELAEQYLFRIWERGRTGCYFDEAYMLPNSGPRSSGYLRAIFTQGRSKTIPAIILTQRPVAIDPFAFSEAQHRSVFYLNHARDRKTIAEFLPSNVDLRNHLPKYHSWWYSNGERNAVHLLPVPQADELIAQINERLAPRERRRVM